MATNNSNETVQLLDESGRFFSYEGMGTKASLPEFYYTQPAEIDYAAIHSRLVEHFPMGTVFVSVGEFQRQAEALIAEVRANEQMKNLFNRLYLPICLPQIPEGDYEQILEDVFLPTAARSYSQAFPQRGFHSDWLEKHGPPTKNGLISIVDDGHRGLVKRMQSGPLVGIFFADAFRGFDPYDCCWLARKLSKGYVLSGGFDAITAFVADPVTMGGDITVPDTVCASLRLWGRLNSFSLGLCGGDLHFDLVNSEGCPLSSAGLLFIGSDTAEIGRAEVVDERGLLIPSKGMKTQYSHPKYNYTQPAEIDYATIHNRLVEHFPAGTVFVSVGEFQRQAEALIAEVRADEQMKKLFNRLGYQPLILPQISEGDYGHLLEDIFLEAVRKSYIGVFPNGEFINWSKNQLKAEVTIVDDGHRGLVKRMQSGPLVGIFFADAFRGFGIEDARQAARELPEGYVLSGGFDAATAFVADPTTMAPSPNTPLVDCAALQYHSSEHSLCFGVADYLGFGSRVLGAASNNSAGLLYIR